HGHGTRAARREEPKLIRRQFPVPIAIELCEQRARRRGKFVEIDLAVLVPVDQRRGSCATDPEAAIVLGLHLPNVDASVTIGVASGKLPPERRFHLITRDCAVAVAIKGQYQPDVLFLLAQGTDRSVLAAGSGRGTTYCATGRCENEHGTSASEKTDEARHRRPAIAIPLLLACAQSAGI